MTRMPTISAQAGITGRVIDLHAGVWTEPDRHGGGRAEDRGACCEDCAPFDRWVASLGGYASRPFLSLWDEAREFAGPGRCMEYLDMARAIDEGRLIDLVSSEEQAAVQNAENAGMVRELVRRLDAAASARRRRAAEIQLAEDQAAIETCLHRSAEVKLAMDELRADPRVARILDADLSGPDLSPAEVTLELRASMGLVNRPPSQYEAGMPAVGDLARAIGVRS